MSDLELRIEALRLAAQYSEPPLDAEIIVKRADKFYAFLRTKATKDKK